MAGSIGINISIKMNCGGDGGGGDLPLDLTPPSTIGISPLLYQWDARDVVDDGNGRMASWPSRVGSNTLSPSEGAPSLSYPIEASGDLPAVKFDDSSTHSTGLCNTVITSTAQIPGNTAWLIAATPISSLVTGVPNGERIVFIGDSSATNRAVYFDATSGLFSQVFRAYLDLDSADITATSRTLANVANSRVFSFDRTIYNCEGFGAPSRSDAATFLPSYCYIHEVLVYSGEVNNHTNLLTGIEYLNEKWGFGLT
jgi:hypothetical protein